MRSYLPLAFVGIYALLLGIGTFLEKPALKLMNAYQMNALTAVGIAIVSVAALLIVKPGLPSLTGTGVGLGLGALIGVGALFYFLGLVKLPVSVAATVANTYVLITVVLSMLFLNDTMTLPKGIGIGLTIAGVMLLSYHSG